MRRTRIRFAPVLAIAGAFVGGLFLPNGLAQQKPADNPPDTKITAGAQEVLLDLIVRDKKGHTVKDLGPGDLEVYDNGQKINISSFRLVEGKEALSKGATVALDPLRQIRLVSLVFERLGSEGRRTSRQAALDLIKNDLGQNVYYAVFAVDQRLNGLQQFTNDREALKKAIERATNGAYSEYAGDSARLRSQLEQQLGPNASGKTQEERALDNVASASQPAGPQAAPDGGAIAQAKFAEIMLRILQNDQNMSSDIQGRSSIYALMALVKEQYRLPGRKTVLYFTEGLNVPVSLKEQFEAVISTANRANVSFYAVDARGLLIAGQNQSSVDQLNSATAASKSSLTKDDTSVSVEEVKAIDNAEQSIRANVQTSLAQLAEGTGGFLIANTNDLRSPLRRVNEDINTYYEATYNPNIQTYDGKFHKITVKSLRADLRVQSRNGYFALPPNDAGTVLPFEMPMLQVLTSKDLPHPFNYAAEAMHFAPGTDTSRCEFVIQVPLKEITFATDDATKTYKARVTAMVLIKDDHGAVVKKFTRDLPLQGGLDKLAGVKAANFNYQEHFQLAPGKYTFETVIYDRQNDKASASRSPFVVPGKANGVSISTISLVRRFEPKIADMDPTNPFGYQGGRITPELNRVLKPVKGSTLAMYFVVFPSASLPDKPVLTIEYFKDGQVVGGGDLPLPPAEKDGRIPYVMSSPAEAMPPGDYDIKATVKQGTSSSEEHVLVTIADH